LRTCGEGPPSETLSAIPPYGIADCFSSPGVSGKGLDVMNRPLDLEHQLPLAPHLFQILLSLLEKDLHGYAILKDIGDRTDGEVTLGTSTLYSGLQRLVRDGFLEEAEGVRLEKGKGPPRNVFRITPLGRRLAREEGLRIQKLSQVVAESGLFDALATAGPGEEGV
jgi:DNA-binding PadR family transcriptional regulator